jgi:hypothetical protein
MAKGRSLHIGVNFLDPAQYLFKEYAGRKNEIFAVAADGLTPIAADRYVIGWRGTLGDKGRGCEKDAAEMAKIAQQQGFDAKLLLSEEATSQNVIATITSARDELQPGDIFLVTYSGHGCHIKDRNNDEQEDNYDETWCLHDRMFIDDEQQAFYSQFRPGVRIVALLDSCHSGTGTRGVHDAPLEKGKLEARCAPREVDDAIYAFGDNTKRYDDLQDRVVLGKRNLNVISISACQDTQQAWGDEDGGVFSNTVREIFANGEFPGNYLQFYESIKQKLPSNPDVRQDPAMDHGLPRNLARALKDHPDDAALIERELASAVKDGAAGGEDELRRLVSFVAERPLRVQGR